MHRGRQSSGKLLPLLPVWVVHFPKTTTSRRPPELWDVTSAGFSCRSVSEVTAMRVVRATWNSSETKRRGARSQKCEVRSGFERRFRPQNHLISALSNPSTRRYHSFIRARYT